MLSAELALAFQPKVEEPLWGGDYFETLEGEVLVALGLIVGVERLQGLVQLLGKGFEALWRAVELYEPLVAATAAVIHEDRRGGVVLHLRPRGGAGSLQTALGVVHNQFLAEGVDKTFGASRDDKLVRVGLREAHRVAYHVAPQSARGGNHHGVVAPRLDLPKRHCLCLGHTHVFQGYELVEHAVVYHQEHGGIGRVVLQTEEALRGVVGFHIVHAGIGDEAVILLAVGRKRHAAVEEHLQVWPHFAYRLAGELYHAVEHRHHPRRHAAEVRDVLP